MSRGPRGCSAIPPVHEIRGSVTNGLVGGP
jgi:hypothetical protein